MTASLVQSNNFSLTIEALNSQLKASDNKLQNRTNQLIQLKLMQEECVLESQKQNISFIKQNMNIEEKLLLISNRLNHLNETLLSNKITKTPPATTKTTNKLITSNFYL